MARFIPAPDLWNPDVRAALDSGALILQPGQWIRLGDGGQLSRFYRHNPATGHVTAFHGREGWATRKLRAYVAGIREEARARLEREASRFDSSGFTTAGRAYARRVAQVMREGWR